MTGLLASVSSLEEAVMALEVGVDILDMKNPASGALGQMPLSQVEEIVALVQKKTFSHQDVITSATVGDLPMQPDLLVDAVLRMKATGVDIIKVGFFGQQAHVACATALGELAEDGLDLIAVLMADQRQAYGDLSIFSNAGFRGVMLDTASKSAGSLTDHLRHGDLMQFCQRARDLNLVTGLAGSLRISHIEILSGLGPDYLGFRGALCRQHVREMALDKKKLMHVQRVLYKYNNRLPDVPATRLLGLGAHCT